MSDADLVHLHYWDLLVWWVLPGVQVKWTRNEAMYVLVCINGQMGMLFQIRLFH